MFATLGLANRSDYRYIAAMSQLQPAASIVQKLGGPSVVAKVAGVHRTRVSNWMRPRSAGGTGGRVPQDHHRALLDYAKQQSVELTAEDFIPAPTQKEAAE